jgi:hypothetical protein
MAAQEPTFEAVLSLAKQLTPGQKLRLIEAIVHDLEEPLQRAEDGEQSLRSMTSTRPIEGRDGVSTSLNQDGRQATA